MHTSHERLIAWNCIFASSILSGFLSISYFQTLQITGMPFQGEFSICLLNLVNSANNTVAATQTLHLARLQGFHSNL